MLNNDANSEPKQWSQLSSEGKKSLYAVYQECGRYYTDIICSLSDKIFNLLFVLNSGGLIGIITILSSFIDKPNHQKLLTLCTWLGTFFFIGLIFIIIAIILEHYRFSKKGELLNKNFNLLQTDKMTVIDFQKNLSLETISQNTVWFFELLSIFMFTLGLLKGLVYLLYLSTH